MFSVPLRPKKCHFQLFFTIFLIVFHSQPITYTEILTVSFSSQIFFNKVPEMTKENEEIRNKGRAEGPLLKVSKGAGVRFYILLSSFCLPSNFGAVWNSLELFGVDFFRSSAQRPLSTINHQLLPSNFWRLLETFGGFWSPFFENRPLNSTLDTRNLKLETART